MISSTDPEQSGVVITFYSYKGGTGRTMAMANVGCALAERDRRPVLLVDWDLEAPGLHRFFEGINGSDARGQGGTNQPDPPGVIDLFSEIHSHVVRDEPKSDDDTRALVAKIDFDAYVRPTGVPNVHLMSAGSFDQGYSDRVNNFSWSDLYERVPSLFRMVADVLASRFHYVLVDSRTGITDSGGICTMLLPEKLVVVFTPTKQSLTGITDLVTRATEYRRESEDLRPLVAYPIPSRIDASEEELKREWRFGGSTVETGYQSQFEQLLTSAYDLTQCDLTTYFDEMQIQHVPRYAYGEQLAVLVEPTGDRLSLARSYRTVAGVLASSSTPWDAFQPLSPSGRIFVDRDREQQLFLRSLRFDGSVRFIVVTGPAGIGKSSLLVKFSELASGLGVPNAVVSLSQVSTPALFMDSITASLATAGLDPALSEVDWSPTSQEGAGKPPTPSGSAAHEFAARLGSLRESMHLVVLIDDFDQATPDVREFIASELFASSVAAAHPPNVLFVVAARAIDAEGLLVGVGADRDPAPSTVAHVHLAPLDAVAIDDLLKAAGLTAAARFALRSFITDDMSPGQVLQVVQALAQLAP